MYFSSIYGAREVLDRHLGGELKKFPQPRGFHWQHGWVPREYNLDPDAIVAEGGWASQQQSHVYLVGREDQAQAMKHFGFPRAREFGLPFAFALHRANQGSARRGGSLLVMPAGHCSFESSEPNWKEDEDYGAFIGDVSGQFKSIAVVLHAQDITLGRADFWKSAGFRVVAGADPTDATRLDRIALLMKEAEFVTSNGLGSHIPYAAAAGCKTSIYGPTAESKIGPYQLFLNRPDLVYLMREWDSAVDIRLREQGFFCEPHSASPNVQWGQEEIGYGFVQPKAQTRLTLTNLSREDNENMVGKLRAELLRLQAFPSIWHFITFVRARVDNVLFQSRLASLASFPNLNPLRNHLVSNLFELFIRRRNPGQLKILDSSGRLYFRRHALKASNIVDFYVGEKLAPVLSNDTRTILNIGAGEGYLSVLWALQFPEAKIYSVEPNFERFQILKQHSSEFPQIRAFQHGLISCKDSQLETEMRSSVPSPGLDGDDSQTGFAKYSTSFESLLLNLQLPCEIDLVRLSVEGLECAVILQNLDVLAEKVKSILVNYQYIAGKHAQIEEIEGFFIQKGFTPSSGPGGHLKYCRL